MAAVPADPMSNPPCQQRPTPVRWLCHDEHDDGEEHAGAARQKLPALVPQNIEVCFGRTRRRVVLAANSVRSSRANPRSGIPN